MAKFTPGAIISEIRGSIANVTYSRSRAGAISKAKLIQTNPNSPAQQAIRALQAAAVAEWQALPQVDQDLWIAFASSQLSRARIDGQHKLSGYNAFIRFYVVRNQYGLLGNPSPAPQLPLGNYSAMSFLASPTSLDFTITGDNLNPDIRIVFRLTDALSPGISSVNQSLLIILLQQPAPNGTISVNLLAQWEARYGSIAAASGKKIFARMDIVNRLTAQRSVVFRGNGFIESSSLLVAVASTGIGNRVMTSPDGVVWTSRAESHAGSWRSVVYSPLLSLWAAIASGGTSPRLMTSPDGINWNSVAGAPTISYRSITWSPSLSLFCAVSQDGSPFRVLTSPDGITWTIRLAAATNGWQSICWSPGLALFIAVANTGIGNRVMTSPDGINWTIRTSAADNDWNSCAWSPGLNLLVAVAGTGIGNRVMTSPDGITWTSRVSAADNDWQDIAWSPGLNLFATVATSGPAQRLMTSPDGITWTIRTPASNTGWQSIVWSASLALFVAVAITGSGNRVMTSPDGVTWTSQVSAANNPWRSIATS